MQSRGGRLQLHRRDRGARIAHRLEPRVEIQDHLFIGCGIGDVGPLRLIRVPAHVVVRLQDHLEPDHLAVALHDGAEEGVGDLLGAGIAAVGVAVLDVAPLIEHADAVVINAVEQLHRAGPGDVLALVVLLDHRKARAALAEVLREQLSALVALITDQLVAVVHKVRRSILLEHLDVRLREARAVHALHRLGARHDLITVLLQQRRDVRPDAKAQLQQPFALRSAGLLRKENKALFPVAAGLGGEILHAGVEGVHDPIKGLRRVGADDRVAYILALAHPADDLVRIARLPPEVAHRILDRHGVDGDTGASVQAERGRLRDRGLVDAEGGEPVQPFALRLRGLARHIAQARIIEDVIVIPVALLRLRARRKRRQRGQQPEQGNKHKNTVFLQYALHLCFSFTRRRARSVGSFPLGSCVPAAAGFAFRSHNAPEYPLL